jgi:hypothetical protein
LMRNGSMIVRMIGLRLDRVEDTSSPLLRVFLRGKTSRTAGVIGSCDPSDKPQRHEGTKKTRRISGKGAFGDPARRIFVPRRATKEKVRNLFCFFVPSWLF